MTLISIPKGPATLVAAPAIVRRQYLKDQFQTYDQATYDSAGAFLIGELERLDPMIHEPLVSTTWTRDIDLRTDVTMGDTSSSYTVSTFGAVGGAAPAGIAWAGLESTARPRAVLDIGKVVNPLDLWSQDVAYSLPELESARQLGRPIDTQMLSALNLKHQMDADQLVYLGDSSKGTTGLLNSAAVVNTGNVATNAAGTSMAWSAKTPDEILADFNELLISVWAASGYVAPPTKVLVAPIPFGYITTVKVSNAGNETILSYLKTRNILTATTGKELDVQSVKWLDKANLNGPGGAAATYDRMVAYSQEAKYVRFPMVPLVPASTQYQGLWVKVPYYGKFGVIETVYPETLGYRDGIR